ncbi:MAG: hypothetical protein QXK37_03930 [Candidatus Woesearchaeota archaeon]
MGTQDIYFEQFYTFTEPRRDTLERAISISYVALVSQDKVNAMENWHDLNKKKLALDHFYIIELARAFLKKWELTDCKAVYS